MSCGGGTQTSTTVQQVPQWVEDAGKSTFAKASSFYDQGFQPYTGQRVAPLTPTQTGAFDQIRGYAPPSVTGEALDMARAGSAPVSTERTVDEGGRLGTIDSYLNPFRAAALDPAIAAIGRSSDAQRKQIGAGATSAHAFGGARHGILDARLGEDTSRAIGDTVSTAMANEYNTAMGQRSTDLNRFLSADEGNRTASMAGASALPQIAAADQGSFMARMQALLGIGGLEQQQGQSQLDVGYQGYQAQQQDAYDRLASLVSVLGGVPYTKTQSTTTPKPSPLDALLGALGAGIGAYAGR